MPKDKFTLEFDMENAAFALPERREEVARILYDIWERVLNRGHQDGHIFDINGNRIGQWSMETDD